MPVFMSIGGVTPPAFVAGTPTDLGAISGELVLFADSFESARAALTAEGARALVVTVGDTVAHTEVEPGLSHLSITAAMVHDAAALSAVIWRVKSESPTEADSGRRELDEMLPEAVVEFDLSLTLTYANAKAFELYKYTREQFEAGLQVLNMIDPEQIELVQRNFAARLQGQDFPQVEYLGMRADGVTFPMTFRAVPLLQNGELVGFRGLIVDLSERKALEERTNQAQRVEALGRLAGGVAHDLNNLLAPILGYSELLIPMLPSGDQRFGFAVQIRQASLRARDLVSQLLALGRRQPLELRAVDLVAVVSNFRPMLMRVLGDDIELVLEAPDLPLIISADEGRLQQVVMNLALNAADAMPEGGRLVIGTQTVDGRVVLSVEDTGMGIDEHALQHLFEPFFSTKGQRGTGLGLAMVYSIVMQHDAEISATSTVGEGSRIEVTFLAAEAEVEPVIEEQPALRPRGTEVILVVEDEPSVRLLAESVLTGAGYTVLSAGGGQEALALLAEFTLPAVMLTDVAMPTMNGRQLASIVSERHPDVKIRFMSGYVGEDLRVEADNQPHPVLAKPFSVRDLLVCIRRAIDT